MRHLIFEELMHIWQRIFWAIVLFMLALIAGSAAAVWWLGTLAFVVQALLGLFILAVAFQMEGDTLPTGGTMDVPGKSELQAQREKMSYAERGIPDDIGGAPVSHLATAKLVGLTFLAVGALGGYFIN